MSSLAGRVRPLVTLLCGLALAVPVLAGLPDNATASTTHPQGDSAVPSASIRVSGDTLRDATGRTVVLHGVDISGTEFACAQGGVRGREGWAIFGGQPIDTPATIRAIQSWHVNVVRVPLNEDCWLGINGINPRFGGTSYVTAITKFVSDLRASGMFVILDLHWNAPGDAVALSQQPMPDADHSIAFWADVAAKFRADTGVIFDLYNEPFLYASYMQSPSVSSWSCWLTGCMLGQYLTGGHPYTKTLGWRAAGMQELLDGIRAAGAKNLVLANGLDWANDDSGWLGHRPVDPASNLAAGWHEYGGETCSKLACWSSAIAPLARTVPVVVGETGDHAGAKCTLTNMPTFLPWADRNGLSYLAWTFNPWRDSHDVLITDWNGTPTECEGQYYSSHLAAIALNPPSIHRDAIPAAPAPAAYTSNLRSPKKVALLLLLVAAVAGIVFVAASMRRNRLIATRMTSAGGLRTSIDASANRLRIVRIISGGTASVFTLLVLMLLYAADSVR